MGSPTVTPPRIAVPAATFVFVSVADLRTSKTPNAVLSTLGLGSCLGVTCYDPLLKIGGLLHTMLPNSARHNPAKPVEAMYLDLGLPRLVEEVIKLGANMRSLEFKVFGGAQILQANEYFSIGRQNIEMMKQMVLRYQFKVKVWDIGGQCNRSIELHLASGRVRLRLPGQPEIWI